MIPAERRSIPRSDAATSLKDKVQTGLDEARTLLLGVEVLLGFQFHAVLQNGFGDLPPLSRYLDGVALLLLLVTVALVIAPAAFHRLVEQGNDSERMHRYIGHAMRPALAPLGLAVGIDLYIVVERFAGVTAGLLAGIGAILVALSLWYGVEMIRRKRRGSGEVIMMGEKVTKTEQTNLKDKITHVLAEARMLLPGAQALLGFQFIAMLNHEFRELPLSSQYTHVASLLMIALATILLIAPAAYHRIVEEGESTESFHRFAGRIIFAAMIPLALGLCGDLHVVMATIFDSAEVGLAAAGSMFLLFALLWFLLPLHYRSRIPEAKRPIFSGDLSS